MSRDGTLERIAVRGECCSILSCFGGWRRRTARWSHGSNFNNVRRQSGASESAPHRFSQETLRRAGLEEKGTEQREAAEFSFSVRRAARRTTVGNRRKSLWQSLRVSFSSPE